MPKLRIILQSLFASLAASALLATPALAAGSNMPWEPTFADISTSVTGPVLGTVGTLLAVWVGYRFSTGDGASGVRTAISAAVGIGIAASATTLLSWLGFAGGALVP